MWRSSTPCGSCSRPDCVPTRRLFEGRHLPMSSWACEGSHRLPHQSVRSFASSRENTSGGLRSRVWCGSLDEGDVVAEGAEGGEGALLAAVAVALVEVVAAEVLERDVVQEHEV